MNYKVLAYLTRETDNGRELLVFTHRDHPGAGIQVPGGSILDGEPPDVAVLREVHEETGLADCRIVRHLTTSTEMELGFCRFVYHLAVDSATPEAWEHVVFGDGEDAGLVFCLRWVPLADVPPLAGSRSHWLHLIRPGLESGGSDIHS